METAEVTALSIGESHVLAVVDGVPLAWGNNGDRKLGTESAQNYYDVAAVSVPPEMPAVRAVAAGTRHSALVTVSGTAYAWGSGHRGALGLVKSWSKPTDFLSFKRKTPALLTELTGQRLVTIAAGKGYTIALSETGVVWTWGSNRWGQCAISGGDQARPLRPRNLQNIGVSNIVAGPYHAMAITFGGGAYTWGRNDQGQLGIGTNKIAKNMEVVPRAWLVQTLFDDGVRVIGGAIGKYHTVFLSDAGHVYTCGMVGSGALGLKMGFFSKLMNKKQDIPKRVETLANVRIVQVAAGDEHTMALSETGDLYVFGSNKAGQLGVTSVRRSTSRPTLVPSLAGRVRAVFAGSKVSMVRAVPSMSPASSPVPGSLQHQASFVSTAPASVPVPPDAPHPAGPADAVVAPPSYEEALADGPSTTQVKYPPVPSAPEKKEQDGLTAGAGPALGGLSAIASSSSTVPARPSSSTAANAPIPAAPAAPAAPPPPSSSTSPTAASEEDEVAPMAPPPPAGAIAPSRLETSDPMEGTTDLVVELPSRPSLDSEAPLSDPEPPEQDSGPPIPPSTAPVVLQADFSTITPTADTPTGALTPRSAPLGLPSPAILVVQAGEAEDGSPDPVSPEDLRSFVETSGWLSSPDNIARDLINDLVQEEAARIAEETLTAAADKLDTLPAAPTDEPGAASGSGKDRAKVAVPGS